jgi:hypothetical protein
LFEPVEKLVAILRENVMDDAAIVSQLNLDALTCVLHDVRGEEILRPFAILEVLLNCGNDWVHW